MRVGVLFERSGVVRQAFRDRGHDAWSNDLVPADDGSYFHIVDDARDVALWPGWDLLICHPPCTYLANSSVQWLFHTPRKPKPGIAYGKDRWVEMQAAAEDFNAMLYDAKAPMVAVENPIMHKHARALIPKLYTQIVQPYQFGHGETKATCLWLKGLPRLTPTNLVPGREGKCHRQPPGVDRQRLRSITYQGIADAMAEQWGGLGYEQIHVAS